jgi:hypothetical protein
MMASASFAPRLAPTVRSRAVERLPDYDRPRSLVSGDKLKWTRIRATCGKDLHFFLRRWIYRAGRVFIILKIRSVGGRSDLGFGL